MIGIKGLDREIPEEVIDELNSSGNPNPIPPDEVRAVIKDSGDRTKC